jgi:hypothetical protein
MALTADDIKRMQRKTDEDNKKLEAARNETAQKKAKNTIPQNTKTKTIPTYSGNGGGKNKKKTSTIPNKRRNASALARNNAKNALNTAFSQDTAEKAKELFLGSSYVAPDGSKPKTMQGTAIYQSGAKKEARSSGKTFTRSDDTKTFEKIANEKGVSGTFGRALTGTGKGFVDATLGMPSAVASAVTGKKVDLRKETGLDFTKPAELMQDSVAFKAGELGGNLLGYGAQNIAAAPLIDSIVAGTKIGKVANTAGNALSKTKIGKLAGEEATKKFANDIAREIVESQTIGRAQNIGIAAMDGKTGLDFVKDVELNNLVDLGAGAVLNSIPMASSALKGRNNAKNINLDALSNEAKKAAETGDFTAKNSKAFNDVVSAVEKRSGVKVVMGDLDDGVDGTYQNGVITISNNAKNPSYTVLKHELTHHIESSGNYKALSDFIVNSMKQSGYDVDGAVKKIRDDYAAQGIKLEDGEDMKEFIAKFSEEFLFNSEESIERLSRENPGLFRQIYDWIVDTIRKIGASDEKKFLIDAQRKYEKALRNVGDVNGNAKKQLSIPYKNDTDKKELLAMHNLHSNELIKQLDMGGMPMPSVAVTNPDIVSHDGFGDITLILNKSAIDPNASKLNKVYSGDAYTPTFPSIDYEANSDAANRIAEKVNALYDNIPEYYQRGIRSLRDKDNINDVLNREGGVGGLLNRYSNDYSMKQLYLAEKGENVPVVTKENIKEMTEAQKYNSQLVIDELGKDAVLEILPKTRGPHNIQLQREWLDKYGEKLKEAYIKAFVESGISKEEATDIFNSEGPLYWIGRARDAANYLVNGGKTIEKVEDFKATESLIDSKIDKTSFNNWLNEMFAGIEGASGIRNNKDLFTASGKRRSFSQLHDPVTLDNVVKTMKNNAQQKGQAAFGGNMMGASTMQYGSIPDIKKDSKRLGMLPKEQHEANQKYVSDTINEIAQRYANGKDWWDARNTLIEAVSGNNSRTAIERYLKKYDYVYKYDESILDDLINLRDYIRNLQTPYFEAKPQRAVGFDEVGAYVIPNNADKALKDRLTAAGYRVVEYDPNIQGDRQRVVNELEDLKFKVQNSSLPETDYTQRLREASKNLSRTDNNGRTLTDGQQKYFKNSKVRDENGNLKVMYHGSSGAGFTVFDAQYSDDGRSFFFTDKLDVASGYSASSQIFSPKEFNSPDELVSYIKKEMDENVEVKGKEGNYELWEDGQFAVDAESLYDLYLEYNDYTGFGGESANYKVYLNLENPLIVDADANNWDEIPVDWTDEHLTTRAIAEYASENGYDGVMINNVIDTGLYGHRFETSNIAIAFDSNQIKNVENANPTKNADIRFSQNTSALPETDYTRRLKAASENLYGEKGNKYIDLFRKNAETVTGNASDKTDEKTKLPYKKSNLKKTANPVTKAKEEARTLIPAAEAEYDRIYEETRQKIEDYIKQYKGKGSQTHLILKNEDATGSAVRQTVSNNDPWYSKALKEYGSNAGVIRHAKELSEKLLDEDLFRAQGQQEMIDGDTWEYIRSVMDLVDEQYQIMNRSERVLPKSRSGKELKPGGADVNKNIPEIKVSKSKAQSFLPENERVTYEAETHAGRDYMADMRLETDYEGEYQDLISKERFTTEDSATAGKIIEKEIADGNISRATKMARKAVQDASLKGQEFEALKHVSDKSPEGKLLRATRAAKNATEQLKKENPRRYKMSEEQAQAIVDIVDEANKNAVSGSFGSVMKKYVRTSGEKLAKNAEKSIGIQGAIHQEPELQKAFDNIVKELSSFAESKILPKPNVPYEHVIKLSEQIAQAQNNPDKYADVLAYAKKILFDKYSDNADAMDKLDIFFNYTHKNYTEKAVNQAVKDFLSGDTLSKIAKSNKNDRAEALKQIRETIIEMVNPDEKTLENLVNDIDGNFNKIVNDKRDALIKLILAPKKSAIQKSLYQRATERINLSEQFIESEIGNSVKQALKDSEVEIGNLIKQSPEEKTLIRERIQSIVESNLNKYGVETEYAAEISNQCKKSYDELLKSETEKVLKKRFGEKKVSTRQMKSVFEDVIELINMGAYDNEDIVNMMLERGNVPVLTPAKAQQIVDYMKKSENASGYEKRMWEARAEQIISDIEQSTAHEKFRSLQRISLLSNPKTLVTRNAGGNILLMAAENMKDIPAAAMDKIVSLKTGQRTTSLDLAKVKAQASGLKKGISEQMKDIKNGVDTSPARAKYELPNKTIWDVNPSDGKFKKLGYGAMDTLDKVIGKSLQFGDRPFYEAAYNSRKTELENLVKKGKSNLSPEEIEESAKLFALDRTFQGDTWLAQRAKAVKKPLGIVGDLIMPFTQTPANILDKLIDYSPAGLGKAMYELGKTSKGTFDQKRFVDIVGRTFTGSGAIMLGYVLNQKGLLTGDIYKETEGGKEYNARQYAGEQEYSLKLGDEYISISWADPVGSLLMIGADFSQAFGTDKESLVTALYQSTKAAANGVFDRSFMSGLAEFLGGNGEISDKIIDGLIEQASQVTPNIGVAITKIIDPVKRETYDADPLKKQLNVIKSRIPVVSKSLPEKKDIMGSTVYQYQGRDTKDRVLESMLLPYNKSQVNKNSVNDYLLDMYNRTGNENVLIGKAGKDINFNGSKYKIETAEDYSKYQELLGKKSAKAVTKLRKDPEFAKKSDSEKAKLIASALSDAKKEAGEDYLISKKITTRTDVNFSKLSDTRRENYDSSIISKEKYYEYFTTASTDGNSNITQKEAQAKIDSMDLTYAQKLYLWQATNKGWKHNPYNQ